MKRRSRLALAVTKIFVSVAFGRTDRAASRAFLRRSVRSSTPANRAFRPSASFRYAAWLCSMASTQIRCNSGSSAIASGSTKEASDSSTNL